MEHDPIFYATREEILKVSRETGCTAHVAGWYFWNETWDSLGGGPFESKAEARSSLDKYCKEELGEK